jgi:hypothetical protein
VHVLRMKDWLLDSVMVMNDVMLPDFVDDDTFALPPPPPPFETLSPRTQVRFAVLLSFSS